MAPPFAMPSVKTMTCEPGAPLEALATEAITPGPRLVDPAVPTLFTFVIKLSFASESGLHLRSSPCLSPSWRIVS